MKHALHFCHRTKQVICLKKVQQSFLTQQLDPPPPPPQSKIPGSAPACPASVQCSLQKNDLEVNNLLSVHRPSSFNLRKTERNIKQLRLMTIKEDGFNLCF